MSHDRPRKTNVCVELEETPRRSYRRQQNDVDRQSAARGASGQEEEDAPPYPLDAALLAFVERAPTGMALRMGGLVRDAKSVLLIRLNARTNHGYDSIHQMWLRRDSWATARTRRHTPRTWAQQYAQGELRESLDRPSLGGELSLPRRMPSFPHYNTPNNGKIHLETIYLDLVCA